MILKWRIFLYRYAGGFLVVNTSLNWPSNLFSSFYSFICSYLCYNILLGLCLLIWKTIIIEIPWPAELQKLQICVLIAAAFAPRVSSFKSPDFQCQPSIYTSQTRPGSSYMQGTGDILQAHFRRGCVYVIITIHYNNYIMCAVKLIVHVHI